MVHFVKHMFHEFAVDTAKLQLFGLLEFWCQLAALPCWWSSLGVMVKSCIIKNSKKDLLFLKLIKAFVNVLNACRDQRSPQQTAEAAPAVAVSPNTRDTATSHLLHPEGDRLQSATCVGPAPVYQERLWPPTPDTYSMKHFAPSRRLQSIKTKPHTAGTVSSWMQLSSWTRPEIPTGTLHY